MSRQVKRVNISGKEDKSNKVISWSSTTTDTHYPSEKLVKNSLDGKASSTHTHTKSQITDFPTSMTPTSHTHGNLQNNGQVGSTAQANKNVVTDSSGKITTEDKPTIPSKTSDLTNDSNFLTSHQSLDSKTVTVEEQAQAETGFTKTYIIKQGGVQVGNKINIPKDFLVKSASVKTVSTANNPVQGYVTGDKYLDFVVNSKDNTATDEHLYVLVSELVDTEIDWDNVQNKPTFFDGNYNNLTNKPTIPTDVSDLTDTTDKQFTPKSHTHTKSQITDFAHNHNDLYYTETETDTLLNGKLDVEDAFTGSYNDLSNKPSIPSSSSDLSDGSDLVKKSSTVGLLKNDGSVMSSGTGSSNWAVGNHTHTTSDITNMPTVPSASSTTPSADTENGSVGTGTTWARSNHTHPKSSLYAEASHTHSQYLTSHQDISGKENTSNKITSISSSSTDTQYPSAKCVYDELQNTIGTIVDIVYPVGSIYMSVNSTNPSVLFGGTWEQIKDTFLLSSGDTYSNGATGGSADAVIVEHTHTQNEHYHNAYGSEYFVTNSQSSSANYRVGGASSGKWTEAFENSGTFKHHRATNSATATNKNTGESGTGKNMPPYLVVNIWERIA